MQEKQVWVLGRPAREILGCNSPDLRRFADLGLLTVRKLPGCDPRYLLADVERLASATTRTAAHHQQAPAA